MSATTVTSWRPLSSRLLTNASSSVKAPWKCSTVNTCATACHWSAKDAVVGVGFTPVLRRTERSLGAIAVEAALDAIRDAGLARDDVDGYVGSPSAPNVSAAHADGFDEVSATYMAASLGLKDPSWVIDVGGMAGGAVVAAAQALAAGTCRYVVVVRALYNPPDRAYSRTATEAAAVDAGVPPDDMGDVSDSGEDDPL